MKIRKSNWKLERIKIAQDCESPGIALYSSSDREHFRVKRKFNCVGSAGSSLASGTFALTRLAFREKRKKRAAKRPASTCFALDLYVCCVTLSLLSISIEKNVTCLIITRVRAISWKCDLRDFFTWSLFFSIVSFSMDIFISRRNKQVKRKEF